MSVRTADFCFKLASAGQALDVIACEWWAEQLCSCRLRAPGRSIADFLHSRRAISALRLGPRERGGSDRGMIGRSAGGRICEGGHEQRLVVDAVGAVAFVASMRALRC